MFGFEFGHMILLGVIALVAIGPKQLPEVARTLGRMLNEFKRATGDFQRHISDMDGSTTQAFRDVHKSLSDSLQPTASAISNFSKANGPTIVNDAEPETKALDQPAPAAMTEPDPQQSFQLGFKGHANEPRALDEANQLSFDFDGPSTQKSDG